MSEAQKFLLAASPKIPPAYVFTTIRVGIRRITGGERTSGKKSSHNNDTLLMHQFISAATVYPYHHWPGDNCVPLSAALWSDSQRTRTVLGRRAFIVCGPATWNALPTELRTATVFFDTFGKQLRLLRDDILDCLFCVIQMRVLID